MWGGGGGVGGGAGHTLLGIGRGRPEQGGLLVRGGRGRQGQSLLATNLLLLLEETAAPGVGKGHNQGQAGALSKWGERNGGATHLVSETTSTSTGRAMGVLE